MALVPSILPTAAVRGGTYFYGVRSVCLRARQYPGHHDPANRGLAKASRHHTEYSLAQPAPPITHSHDLTAESLVR